MTAAIEFYEVPVLHGLSRLTAAEFFQLCQVNPQVRLERNANHEIIIMPPAHPDADESGTKIIFQLRGWNLTQHPAPGHGYGPSAGFVLPSGAIRSPDVAWLSRAARAVAQQAGGFLAACPEFVVEILSPSDRLKDLQAKMEEYLANGVQLGFLLDVDNETAYVYRPGQPAETVMGYEQELSGEPVLPGFRLDLRPLRRQ
jgi:Uma2 family endonuclease